MIIRKQKINSILHTTDLGVTFSIKTCLDYGINWEETLSALISLGIKRFRIMSYWDLHQPADNTTNFDILDKQLEMIETAGARVTLCIGMRQPRWPETHVPKWALELEESSRIEKYLVFHKQVIERYKNKACIESWQLENEFWNKSFGENNTFSRKRLIKEFTIIRQSDLERPVIMSLGNTVGLPIFRPKPDLFGTTMYLTQFEKGKYSKTKYSPQYFRTRALLVRLIGRRPLIIHELQAEPWGPKANWEMSIEEQDRSMSAAQIKRCIAFAQQTKMKYMDLWGSEWWYWRKVKFNDPTVWNTVKDIIDTYSK